MSFSIISVNAMAAAWGALLNNGTLELYTGNPPAEPEDATGETLLADIALPASAFTAPVDGVITMEPVTTVTASGTGTVAWARLKNSTGDAIYDGAVGTVGTPFIIDTVALSIGEDVAVVSFILTQPKV